MTRIAIVGCTGKLGSVIMNAILNSEETVLSHAIARPGNQFVGRPVSDIIGGKCELTVTDDIEDARDCHVFIDCTGAQIFMERNYSGYQRMKKPLVIATTGFDGEALAEIKKLSEQTPVFMSGNFSTALYDFIATLKFAAARISDSTDVQIVEYHHNQKKDAPSGTALMIRDALTSANSRLTSDAISICSVRGGSIFGEHEVIFANCKDEVMTFRHQVSSREAFADGAVKAAIWTAGMPNGFYGMDDLCGSDEKHGGTL